MVTIFGDGGGAVFKEVTELKEGHLGGTSKKRIRTET